MAIKTFAIGLLRFALLFGASAVYFLF